MDRLQNVATADLREKLTDVEELESAERLMAAILHKQGVSLPDLAEWFGFDEADIDEWFAEFEENNLDEVIDQLERYSQQSPTPYLPRPTSRVEYLNYEVLDDHGWDLHDENLFEKAHAADLDPEDFGRILVKPHESLLEAVENRGFTWPYACRGGACANCAVQVKAGEMAMPGDHILTDDMVETGVRLACVGAPTTEFMQVVYNVKHRPELDDLRLPPRRFEVSRARR